MRATLVTDGASDKVLLEPLRWVLGKLTPTLIELRWADLRRLREQPRGLQQKAALAIFHYPCELLFIHRDAERTNPQLRYEEIAAANQTGLPHVCVVPVRMQEAWLLLDEAAIREASDRPRGTEPLGLPPLDQFEELPDPKATLHRALRLASGATGRRAKNFQPAAAAHRLADLVADWSPLRTLSAFQRLEADTRAALAALGLPLHSKGS